ncbi:MAG: hypothetical protein Q8941_09645 [Bacteroidota bacterium]|nr:hypothetical protein [Bacteroidota bacterium]
MLKNFTLKGVISLCLIFILPAIHLPAQQITTRFQRFDLNASAVFRGKISFHYHDSGNSGNNYSAMIITIPKETSAIKGIMINPNPGFNEMVTARLTGNQILSAKFTIAR